jgi:hypothetical protein
MIDVTQAEIDEIEAIRQELHTFLESRGHPLDGVSTALSIVATDIFLAQAQNVEKACTLVRAMAKTMQEDMRHRQRMRTSAQH